MATPLIRSLALAAVLLTTPASGVELTLDGVVASSGGRDYRLRLTSKASFDFNPATGSLRSSGTWIIEYVLPNYQNRFSDKVEDFSISPDGQLAMRSYECVEGTFGAGFLGSNVCGNYGFGPNGIDEGGLVDDVVNGPPRSLAAYGISSRDWDGSALVLTLTSPDGNQSLTLTLHPKAVPTPKAGPPGS